MAIISLNNFKDKELGNKIKKICLNLANKGDGDVQYILHRLYFFNGDRAESLKWGLKSANNNSTSAAMKKSVYVTLGAIYQYGLVKGNTDHLKALKWYFKALKEYNVLAVAGNIANIFNDPNSPLYDPKEGSKWSQIYSKLSAAERKY